MNGKVLLRLHTRFHVDGVHEIGLEPKFSLIRLLLDSRTPPVDHCLAIYASAESASFEVTSPFCLVEQQQQQQQQQQHESASGDWLDDYFKMTWPASVRTVLQAYVQSVHPSFEPATPTGSPPSSPETRRAAVSCVAWHATAFWGRMGSRDRQHTS